MIKALLIGALPYPFEGPWVPMNGGRRWRYDPEHNFDGRVVLEYRKETSPPQTVPLNGEPVEFEADYARVVVGERFQHDGSFTVEVRSVGND